MREYHIFSRFHVAEVENGINSLAAKGFQLVSVNVSPQEYLIIMEREIAKGT